MRKWVLQLMGLLGDCIDQLLTRECVICGGSGIEPVYREKCPICGGEGRL